jgi:predicted DCC family thiol-disulfide oxidoreductase YuxK
MLYDGVCGFCDRTVRWLITHDADDRLRFAPQQSALAKEILGRHGIDQNAETLSRNSAYLVLDLGTAQERLLERSDVMVTLLSILGGTYGFWAKILQKTPRSLRNATYALIAGSRYRLGGRYDHCPLPAPENRKKFAG